MYNLSEVLIPAKKFECELENVIESGKLSIFSLVNFQANSFDL